MSVDPPNDDNSVVSPKILTPSRRRRTLLLLNASCFDPEISENEALNSDSESNFQYLAPSAMTSNIEVGKTNLLHDEERSEVVDETEDVENKNEKEEADSLHSPESTELVDESKEDEDKIEERFSFCEVVDTGCSPIVITPVTVRNLGRNYRTPPVSPLGKPSPSVDLVNQSRLKSTPVRNTVESAKDQSSLAGDYSKLVHRSRLACSADDDSDETSSEDITKSSTGDISEGTLDRESASTEKILQRKSVLNETSNKETEIMTSISRNSPETATNGSDSVSVKTEDSMLEVQDTGCSPIHPASVKTLVDDISESKIEKNIVNNLSVTAQSKTLLNTNNENYVKDSPAKSSVTEHESSIEIDITELEETDVSENNGKKAVVISEKDSEENEKPVSSMSDTQPVTPPVEEKSPSRFKLRRSLPLENNEYEKAEMMEGKSVNKCDFDFNRMSENICLQKTLNPLSPAALLTFDKKINEGLFNTSGFRKTNNELKMRDGSLSYQTLDTVDKFSVQEENTNNKEVKTTVTVQGKCGNGEKLLFQTRSVSLYGFPKFQEFMPRKK